MKTLPANILTQINAQQRKPVALVEIYLDDLTLRYAANIDNIIFPHTEGEIYTAKAIELGEFSQTLEGQVGKITIKLDNTAKDMFAYTRSYTFDGRMIVIKRIFLDADNNAPEDETEYVEIFSGTMNQPKEISRHWVTVTAYEGKPLTSRMIQRVYGKQCQHLFGDAQCNKNGYSNLSVLTVSGTAKTTTPSIKSSLTSNALNQTSYYWNFGIVEVTKDNITYTRKVKVFNADKITFDFPLPIYINSLCTFTVWKGCPKTLDACQANNTYGPSFNNSENFGGFSHVGIWRED